MLGLLGLGQVHALFSSIVDQGVFVGAVKLTEPLGSSIVRHAFYDELPCLFSSIIGQFFIHTLRIV